MVLIHIRYMMLQNRLKHTVHIFFIGNRVTLLDLYTCICLEQYRQSYTQTLKSL